MTQFYRTLLARTLAAAGAALVSIGAAQASVYPSEPVPGRAYAVVNACGDAALGMGEDGLGAGVALRAWPAPLWLLEPADAGFRLRRHGDGRYLGLSSAGDGLTVTTADAGQAVVWALTPPTPGRSPGDGAFHLQVLGQNRFLSLVGPGAPALVSASRAGCEGGFAFDAFPVMSGWSNTIYVDAEGPWDGDGSALKPYANIQHAIDRARPGDRILVAPGVYRYNLTFQSFQSGTADAWIVLQSMYTGAARIEALWSAPTIDIHGRFIELHGFAIGSDAEHSCISGSGSHVRIVENRATDCAGGGISFTSGSNYHIEGNVAARNAFLSPFQASGISLFQARGDDCGGAFCNVIRRNVAYGNDNRTPNTEGLPPQDGNGIMIDDFDNTFFDSTAGIYPGRTLVEHNLSFANGGSGFRVFLSRNVTVRNNTSYHNHRRADASGWRGEFMQSSGRDNVFERNVAVADTEVDANNRALFDTGTFGGGAPAVWRDNVAAANPARAGAGFRSIRGRPSGAPYIGNVAPVFERPGYDEKASFALSRLVDGAGRTVELGFAVGADPALLPPTQ